MTTTRGVVHIHSAPSALCPHVEWALGGVLGVPAGLKWTPQPVEPGTYRSEVSWRGAVGTAARMASAMKRWDRVRFEVTEDATGESEGERFSYTPSLGVFHAPIGRNGDVLVHEDRLRVALARHRDAGDLRAAIDRLVGAPWDAELEAFRKAEPDAGASVRWLHRVG